MDRSIIGNLRLFSGLILFVFVLGHFTNHALGIISLRAMNDWLWLFIQPWRDPFGEFLLILALTVHVGLALYSLYMRKSLNMKWQDSFQLLSGFLIPLLLAKHILATRGIHEALGVTEGYEFVLYGLWVSATEYGVINAIALPLVWFHACLGWHMWFRLKSWYPPLKPWALGLAVLVPTLAMAGYISAGLRVSRLSNSENWVSRIFKRTADMAEEIMAFVNVNADIIRWSVLLSILLILIARLLINYIARNNAAAHVNYRDVNLTLQEKLAIVPGSNVLDLLRGAQISHAAVCGGRGRCSTCRVRIDNGFENLPPPSAHEQLVLKRISAPPNVRLACQLSPVENLSVTALLKADAGVQDVLLPTRHTGGEEQEIAVLFADIRAFTKLSETKLPYDTAFLLNRYFAAMGQAIESGGGHLDKFIGDGVMALFGIDKGLEEGSRMALAAASLMSERLDELNESLRGDLDEPLRIGIGIHAGTAIVGNMGYNRATGLTAIGDVVNTASRLEALTKEFGVQLVVSKQTVLHAGLAFEEFPLHSTAIRGRDEALEIYAVESAKQIKTKTSE